jgi:tripartite-type tricarboxylate transporter receptor subunit TctC
MTHHTMKEGVVTTLMRGLLIAAALLQADAAAAQTYPSRPVRLIVPFAAGGPTDVIGRIVAQKLSESFGQQIYVEDVPGAGGNTGTAMVAKAQPDGYTMLVVSTGFMVNPSLYAKVPYDPIKDFAPITLVRRSAATRRSCSPRCRR